MRKNALTRAATVLVLALVVLLGLGCGGGGENPVAPAAKVTELRLSSSQVTLEPEDQVTVSASPRDKDGRERERQVSWSSNNPSVATVSSSGLTGATVTGVAPGTASITASAEGLTAQLSVTVRQVVAVVAVSPSAPSVYVGQVTQLNAAVTDKRNVSVPGAAVTWSTSAPAIATVSASGGVAGVGVGSATITATSEGRSGSAQVTVTIVPVATVSVSGGSGSVQVGQALQLSATLRDAQNNILTERTVTWSSSHPNIASVNGTGLVTGVAPGPVTITATSEGKSGAAQVTVTQPAVATVTVTPSHGGLIVAGTLSLAATLRDSNNSILMGRIVIWSSSNVSVVSVDASTGVVTGVSEGRATITATSEGISGNSQVAVVDPLVVKEVAVDGGKGCAILKSGGAYCWGGGALGDGLFRQSASPVPVLVQGGASFESIYVGAGGCGIAAAGTAHCWGMNGWGEVGNGTRTTQLVPVPVTGGHSFRSITIGSNAHTCGVTTTNVALCWGFNGQGQLGDGTQVDRISPVFVAGGLLFDRLGAGGVAGRTGLTCGLTLLGTAFCWGVFDPIAGIYTQGVIHPVTTVPTQVLGGVAMKEIAVGNLHACGLDQSGAAYCWGSNASGQLGDGTTTLRPQPVPVAGGHVYVSVTAGHSHACGLTASGNVYCWGSGVSFGTETFAGMSTPVSVGAGLVFRAIQANASAHTTCGITTGDIAFCWGNNLNGQLGIAVPVGINAAVPIPIGWP